MHKGMEEQAKETNKKKKWRYEIWDERDTLHLRVITAALATLVKGKVHPQNRPRGGAEVQPYSFFNLDDRWGGWTTFPALPPRKRPPVPIVQEAGWAPGPVWTGAENLAPPSGSDPPARPARSESLYRLSYPGPYW